MKAGPELEDARRVMSPEVPPLEGDRSPGSSKGLCRTRSADSQHIWTPAPGIGTDLGFRSILLGLQVQIFERVALFRILHRPSCPLQVRRQGFAVLVDLLLICAHLRCLGLKTGLFSFKSPLFRLMLLILSAIGIKLCSSQEKLLLKPSDVVRSARDRRSNSIRTEDALVT
jgi:hypothetical protein